MGMPRSHSLQVDDADVQFYRDHGYFVYQHPLFPQEKFQRLQTLFAGLLAELPEGKRPEAMDVRTLRTRVYLARGQDRAGNEYGDLTAPFARGIC